MQYEPSVAFTRLGAVFPNPGPGPTSVRFDLAQQGEVRLELYDLRGALVRGIASGIRSPGSHTESWDGRDRSGRELSSGIYLLRFEAGQYRETRRLVILQNGRLSSQLR